MTDHARWNGAQLVAFAIAIVFGVATALGLAAERIALGGSGRAMWISAAVMASVMLMIFAAEVCRRSPLASEAEAPEPRGSLGPQAAGALLPVIAVHAYVAIAARDGTSTLVEGPAQLVNDVVLVFGLFALVQGVVAPRRGQQLLWIAATAVLVAVYARTAACWHQDRFDGLAVQRYVIAQVAAAAAGILLLIAVRSARRLTP